MAFESLPTQETLNKTISSLKSNNFDVSLVQNGDEAKTKVFSLIPKGAQVLNNTSITLDTLGISDTIMNSGEYVAVKKQLTEMNREKENRRMQEIGSAPEYAIGSVHAVTEDGTVLIASNSGSNLPSYAYGADHVIWVVGAQKIVKDLDEGFKRVYEHSLPLESERAKKAYGVPGSFVSKLLLYNKEPNPGRTTIILVNEVLGF